MASPPAPPEWLKPYKVVLAKMAGSPHCPAIVCHEYNRELGKRWAKVNFAGRQRFWVVFLNDYRGAWIELAKIMPYTPKDATNALTSADDGWESASEYQYRFLGEEGKFNWVLKEQVVKPRCPSRTSTTTSSMPRWRKPAATRRLVWTMLPPKMHKLSLWRKNS